MEIENKIVSAVVLGIKTLYGQDIAPETVQLQKTKKEFAGHLTLVVFPFLKYLVRNRKTQPRRLVIS